MPGLNSNLISSLRRYIIDLPEYNQLNLNEVELDLLLIEEAVKDGVTRYDILPPLSTTAIDSLLETSKEWYFIKRFSAIEAVQMLIFKNIRNRHAVSDPGMINVDEFDKASDWNSLMNSLMSEFEPKVIQYKRSLSLMSASWDTVSFATE